MTVTRRSALGAARRLGRWTADSVRLSVTGDGLVRMAAPCGEARTMTPEAVEALCVRLTENAARAREAPAPHERKLQAEQAEVIYPDIGALTVN